MRINDEELAVVCEVAVAAIEDAQAVMTAFRGTRFDIRVDGERFWVAEIAVASEPLKQDVRPVSTLRVYRRAASSFDGSTAESGAYDASGLLFTTSATGAVGVFSSAVLGRANTFSRVNVPANAVGGADTFAIKTAGGATKDSTSLLTAGSTWLLMAPGDSLVVTSGTASTIDIFVQGYATTYLTADSVIERRATRTVAINTDYTAVQADRYITISTSAAGAGNTITLGNTGVVHQRIIIRMTAHDTNDYTVAVLGGTLTFDAADKIAMVYHIGSGVWVPFLPAGALAATYA